MLRQIVKQVYDSTVRSLLPYKFAVFNGVPVSGYARLFDFSDELPDYKQANITAVREHVQTGDRVVVIGGGYGVTAVVAARRVGSDGRVTVYEASTDRVDLIRETTRINKVDDICDVRHALVGNLHKAGGKLGNPAQIDPSDIVDGDVLEMDCEGAETRILPNLSARPGVLIVETHPEHGSHTEDVVEILEHSGYRILSQKKSPADGHILTAASEN